MTKDTTPGNMDVSSLIEAMQTARVNGKTEDFYFLILRVFVFVLFFRVVES